MNIILTAVLAFVLQLFFPWWIVSIAAGIVALFSNQTLLRSFLNGFAGIAILWIGWSGYIYFTGGDVLANKLAGILSLPYGWMTLLVTALVGGIVGGFGALTTSALKNTLNK
ncbi:MAG TPA: hypothetical protein DCE78_02925 [Bacteroidetes bacterium]|nr:hypothetical protein [Bacteroidota bacterium]